MKPIISLLMVLSILIFTISCSDNIDSINNNKNNENSNSVNMEQIKEKIVATENKVNELFSTDVIKSIVISYLDGNENIPIYNYAGVNNKFSDVCSQLQDYCTPNVAEILIRKIGFINVDGNIGAIATGGEVNFELIDENYMKIESLENDIAIVNVTRFTDDRDYSQDFLYSLKFDEKGEILIIDLKEVE